MAFRSATSERRAYGDLFAELLALRVAIGAAALGFLGTFLLLDHEIPAFKNVILPLLVFLPAYLFLMSLSASWGAQSMAKQGLIGARARTQGTQRVAQGVLKACCSLALGVLAALLYVHSVSR